MEQKKKLAIIGTVGLPANYGGFETLTEFLVKNLGDKYDMTVYCSSKKYKKEERRKEYLGAKLKFFPLDANGIQSIPYDTISIIHSLFYADVLLVLGVAGAWILPFVKLFTKKKIIISIDGIEWKRDKWNILAKWFLFWSEGIAVNYSHIDISDNESIQNYTASRYGSLSRIIAYGGDHTLKVAPTEDDKIKYPFLNYRYTFKVCRIEPENNVHEVIKAFSLMPKEILVMVGNWKNSEYGINLKNEYNDFDNIMLLDPIYDQPKLDLLRGNASVYIHGHSAGGTNPSLVEAMYLGLPILSFDVSYNRSTTENKALYFKNHKDLMQLISSTTPSQMKEKGEIMKSIALRRYTWPIIAKKYDELFQEALSTKNKLGVRAETSELEAEELQDMGLGHLKHQRSFFEKR